MQINFHLSPEDERSLLNYIFERSGYFVAYDRTGKSKYETFFSDLPDNSEYDYRYTELMLFRMDYAPVEFQQTDGVFSRLKRVKNHPTSKLVRRQEIFDETGFKKEFIQYSRCVVKNDTLHWGRFWMNGLEAEPVKFYRNICAYIRKNCTRSKEWEWVGKNVPNYLKNNQLQLGQHF